MCHFLIDFLLGMATGRIGPNLSRSRSRSENYDNTRTRSEPEKTQKVRPESDPTGFRIGFYPKPTIDRILPEIRTRTHKLTNHPNRSLMEMKKQENRRLKMMSLIMLFCLFKTEKIKQYSKNQFIIHDMRKW